MGSISLRSVGKVYPGGVRALQDLSLEIADGEFVVFVGSSGCGKTTALRMIAGLEPIEEGEIRLNDALMNEVEPRQRDMAMVFQNYALYPHMTIFDNIAFPLQCSKVERPEIRRRVADVAAMLGLEALLARKPRALSGGQRQRVAMGRAIVRKPQAFLMDEPLSNLDAKLRMQMRGEITALQRRLGTTTVYVTHDQVEAMTMGSRIAVMRKGLLQQMGPPGEIYNFPARAYVAGFIGSPGMNFLPGRLSAQAGALVCSVGESVVTFGGQGGKALSSELSSCAGRGILVGIRPEKVRAGGLAEGRQGLSLKGVAQSAEILGHECLARLQLQGVPEVEGSVLERLLDNASTGRVAGEALRGDSLMYLRLMDGTSVTRGDRLELGLPLEDLRLFDIDSGDCIKCE